MDKYTGTEKVMGTLFESRLAREKRIKEESMKNSSTKTKKTRTLKEQRSNLHTKLILIPKPGCTMLSNDTLEVLYSNSINGLIIETMGEEVPFAWDPDIKISDNNIIVFGGIAPGVFGQSGMVEITIPVEKFSDYYMIYYELNNLDNVDSLIAEDIKENNWDYRLE